MSQNWPKLKKSVVIKKNSENQIYAIDVEVDEDAIFTFNGPALFFLNCLKEGLTREETILKLNNIYHGIDEEKVQKDLENFLTCLQEFKLIE